MTQKSELDPALIEAMTAALTRAYGQEVIGWYAEVEEPTSAPWKEELVRVRLVALADGTARNVDDYPEPVEDDFGGAAYDVAQDFFPHYLAGTWSGDEYWGVITRDTEGEYADLADEWEPDDE